MSAAEKSYTPVPRARLPRRSNARPTRPKAEPVVRSKSPDDSATPKKPSVPPGPGALGFIQKVTSAITFSLLGATLGIYAWTVYIPKVWDKEYGKLETLQRHERHLLATNETLKHQLAEQAERPETGFGNPRPFQTIFLRRSPDAKLQPVSSDRPGPSESASRKAY
ncbi:hypothetical protein V0288_07595 [Pannus brasiliensis CCIBt3594]|uniref:Cell division protein FtsL n=1 Tax=Pannus brasiliensis CCIBt3594 TaxID=1427578 RepID=A0AAW9QTC2_9CHRO